MQTDRRMDLRFMVSLPIRVEWDDSESGERVRVEGTTENVGPEGTLVHLPRALPRVGSVVRLAVFEMAGVKEIAQAAARVLRLERNPAHPQVALKLVDSVETWQANVYENDEVKLAAEGKPEDYED